METHFEGWVKAGMHMNVTFSKILGTLVLYIRNYLLKRSTHSIQSNTKKNKQDTKTPTSKLSLRLY